MKKIILGLIVTLLVLTTFVSPALADAPTMENWEFFAARNHTTYGYYAINTVNLQVQSFTLVNNDAYYVTRLQIVYDTTDVIFEMYAYPGETVTQPINNFKLLRLPLTDPDDPDSIRYPNKIIISCGSGNY